MKHDVFTTIARLLHDTGITRENDMWILLNPHYCVIMTSYAREHTIELLVQETTNPAIKDFQVYYLDT